jgi:hypothetical protein
MVRGQAKQPCPTGQAGWLNHGHFSQLGLWGDAIYISPSTFKSFAVGMTGVLPTLEVRVVTP